jgi:hypothetical protein
MMEEEYDRERLRNTVQACMANEDMKWYRFLLRNAICACPLRDEEEQAVLSGSMQTAEELARQFDGFTEPQLLLRKLGINMVYRSEELREPYLYMAIYEPAIQMVYLNNSILSLLREFISKNNLGIFTPIKDIERLALFHEAFHVLEENTPGIYTRSRMLQRKFLGVYHYERGLDSASEIGAIHFSKIMTQSTYSPCIYSRYVLLALGLIPLDSFLPNV